MFHLIYKRSLFNANFSANISKNVKPYFLQTNLLSTSASKDVTTTLNTSKEHSFTVSYLVNSCGFPLKRAISVSKYLNFDKTPEKPQLVRTFFKKHGFTDVEASKLIRQSPQILKLNPEKAFLPKMESLQSKGLSRDEMAKVLCRDPNILTRSMEKQIIPNFSFLRDLVGTDDDVIRVIKLCPQILLINLERWLVPSVEILRDAGVPESRIVFLLKNYPNVFEKHRHEFKESVEEVKNMGFNPLKTNFILGVVAIRKMSKLTWKYKMEVYKRWGLSEDQVLGAFKNYPWCMTLSEEKIMENMGFLVREMGFEPSIIIRRPQVISRSLKRTIIPRCSVYQVLLSKGLIKRTSNVPLMLVYTEKMFLKTYVESHKDEIPQLLRLYQEKLKLSKVRSM